MSDWWISQCREKYRTLWKNDKGLSIPSTLFSHRHQLCNSKFCINPKYSLPLVKTFYFSLLLLVLITFHGSHNLAKVEITGDHECFHSCFLKITFHGYFLSAMPLRFSHLFLFSPSLLQISYVRSITHIQEIIIFVFLFKWRLQERGSWLCCTTT